MLKKAGHEAEKARQPRLHGRIELQQHWLICKNALGLPQHGTVATRTRRTRDWTFIFVPTATIDLGFKFLQPSHVMPCRVSKRGIANWPPKEI